MTLAQMPTVVHSSQIENVMRDLLGQWSDQLAQESGFMQRKRSISGAIFAQTLIFGWLINPEASYTQLQQLLAILGCDASAQALEKRMTREAADFLLVLLYTLMGICVESDGVMTELLSRFDGVYLQDGTIITLPPELSGIYKGFGASSGEGARAAMRVQVRLNLLTGGINGACIGEAAACERDEAAALLPDSLPAGSLLITDSAYVTLESMREAEQQGHYWLTHARANWQLQDCRGVEMSLCEWVYKHGEQDVFEEWVWLGKKGETRQKRRLILFRVSDQTVAKRRAREGKVCKTRPKGCRRDVGVGKPHQRPSIDGRHRDKTSTSRARLNRWTILLTNAPFEQLKAHEARVLMRARWQIELLWCLWKERGLIDIWRSEKPMRILCEIYAKLMGMIIQHWLILRGCWSDPRRSMQKASQAVQVLALCYLLTLWGPLSNAEVQRLLQQAMARSRPNTRPKRLCTAHLLQEPHRVLRLS